MLRAGLAFLFVLALFCGGLPVQPTYAGEDWCAVDPYLTFTYEGTTQVVNLTVVADSEALFSATRVNPVLWDVTLPQGAVLNRITYTGSVPEEVRVATNGETGMLSVNAFTPGNQFSTNYKISGAVAEEVRIAGFAGTTYAATARLLDRAN